MTIQTVFEYKDKKITPQKIMEQINGIWKKAGNNLADIHAINLYIKPEEAKIYYVVNQSFSGCISFYEPSLCM